ncbi:BTB/POZ domain-containing protein At1g21780-like [Chenopodium quinoa]|uniref:BTB domain-containing protein n=1 Tax=Chenopodium quinoa TaxID=63459 RepID=A0A803LV29_CHEQI|nr:BTB/POZ domain-containing protein At1g21780-like [Chenopodium quinoa]
MYESVLSLSPQQQSSENQKKMGDTKVETISRLAQWKIDNFGPCSYKKSDPFKLGLWNWHLAIEKNRYLYVRLFPEPSRVSKDQPPLARFILRVSNLGLSRRPYISPIHERLLRNSDDFVWPVDTTFYGRFIIDVEFLDLKICPSTGGQAVSIWPTQGNMQSLASQSALQTISRMLYEEICTDVTITTVDGTLKAHKAMLSASSPVFQSMFLHDLKEKESSTIAIDDMSWESCRALLSYIYGTMNPEDFWKHRLGLLAAANKYDMTNLKDACEESLLEDINSGNVLERLQEAWLYKLDKLKKGCLTYLFDFGKIYDIKDDLSNFFQNADRELLTEMFQEILTAWKPA